MMTYLVTRNEVGPSTPPPAVEAKVHSMGVISKRFRQYQVEVIPTKAAVDTELVETIMDVDVSTDKGEEVPEVGDIDLSAYHCTNRVFFNIDPSGSSQR